MLCAAFVTIGRAGGGPVPSGLAALAARGVVEEPLGAEQKAVELQRPAKG